ERGLEQLPSGQIEIFEKPDVEDDAGWVALTPFDPDLAVIDERRHESLLSEAILVDSGAVTIKRRSAASALARVRPFEHRHGAAFNLRGAPAPAQDRSWRHLLVRGFIECEQHP